MTTIQENYRTIWENIDRALTASGRAKESVRLLAVTKYVDVGRIGEALLAGASLVGENRVQELNGKLTFYKQHGCEVHLIGQLQTNKLKYICGQVAVIESLDRMELAEALERRAGQMNVVQDAFVQVNIGEEPQKGGVEPKALLSFLDTLSGMPHIRVRGLMCVPPALPPEETRPYFVRMRRLFLEAQAAHPEMPLSELSMGMSHDYAVAVEEGATIVRVGTALFGARVYA